MTTWEPLLSELEKTQANPSHIRQLRGFLATTTLPTDRRNEVGHLTASGVIVSTLTSQVLLMRHRKLSLWLQTGGHCEIGESLVDAALREAHEESGLLNLDLSHARPVHLDAHEVPCGQGTSVHYDVRYSGDPRVIIVSDEATDLRWFSVDQLPYNMPEASRSAVNAASKYVRNGI